jgi:hypothetical protein
VDPMWLAVRYLLERAACRARAALRGEPESGALSLEWIVIAVAVVAAAGVAAVLFTRAVRHEAGKLP